MDLTIFIATGWVEFLSVEKLAESQIKHCVKKSCKKESIGEELYLVDQTVMPVAIQTHMLNSKDRIRALGRAYLQALRISGYAEIIETRTHISIEHFLKKQEPF